MARSSSTKRERVLVNVSRAPTALADALAQTSQWHRGRRLIELATLGLASEQCGLRVDTTPDGELQLYAGISRIAGLLETHAFTAHPQPAPPLEGKKETPLDDVHISDDFIAQWVN